MGKNVAVSGLLYLTLLTETRVQLMALRNTFKFYWHITLLPCMIVFFRKTDSRNRTITAVIGNRIKCVKDLRGMLSQRFNSIALYPAITFQLVL